MMNSFRKLTLAAWAGTLALSSTAWAGSPIVRTVVRDAQGKARIAYVRVADRRIVFPQVVRQVTAEGGRTEYRPALSTAYRPGLGYGYGYGQGTHRGSFGYYGVPGRRYFPVGTGYPSYYRPLGNYGVDSILYHGNRGRFGIPGYGLPGGAFPRPVVKAQLPGLPQPRYSGNVKGR